MIVLGRRRVEFVVTQFVNGVVGDDCQEVLVEGVEIRLEGLPESVIDVGGGDVMGGNRGGNEGHGAMTNRRWTREKAKL